MKSVGPELEAATKQVKKLKLEIEKLGEALLTTDAKPATIVKMMADRERQLAEAEARIAASKIAPEVIDAETRRIEKQTRAKLADLRALLAGSPEDGRAALELLLDGPLVVTPLQDENGDRSVRRFHLTGRTVLGAVAVAGKRKSASQDQRRGQSGASPTGFEPVLAA